MALAHLGTLCGHPKHAGGRSISLAPGKWLTQLTQLPIADCMRQRDLVDGEFPEAERLPDELWTHTDKMARQIWRWWLARHNRKASPTQCVSLEDENVFVLQLTLAFARKGLVVNASKPVSRQMDRPSHFSVV
jgi:hypothetical protein